MRKILMRKNTYKKYINHLLYLVSSSQQFLERLVSKMIV